MWEIILIKKYVLKKEEINLVNCSKKLKIYITFFHKTDLSFLKDKLFSNDELFLYDWALHTTY